MAFDATKKPRLKHQGRRTVAQQERYQRAELAKSGNPLGKPRLFCLAINQCKLFKLMVVERGFEPPTPWSRTSFRLLHFDYSRCSSRSRSHVKMTGVTIKTRRRELTIPPRTGAASGLMNSAPVRVDHINGKRPATTVATVITFGRSRKSAPSITAACRLARVRRPSAALRRARRESTRRRTSSPAPPTSCSAAPCA